MVGLEIYSIPTFQNVHPSHQDALPETQAPLWFMDFVDPDLWDMGAFSISRAIFDTTAVYVFTGVTLHKIAMPADGSTDLYDIKAFTADGYSEMFSILSDYRGIFWGEPTETEGFVRAITFGQPYLRGCVGGMDKLCGVERGAPVGYMEFDEFSGRAVVDFCKSRGPPSVVLDFA